MLKYYLQCSVPDRLSVSETVSGRGHKLEDGTRSDSGFIDN